jgi:putative ABC transport system ATP-binding protein
MHTHDPVRAARPARNVHIVDGQVSDLAHPSLPPRAVAASAVAAS